MGRLIDTSAFDEITIQGKSEEFVNGAKYILDLIDAQPTAFDIKRVVAELKEKAEKYNERAKLSKLTAGNIFCVTENYRAMGIREAIFIVKKGGVE